MRCEGSALSLLAPSLTTCRNHMPHTSIAGPKRQILPLNALAVTSGCYFGHHRPPLSAFHSASRIKCWQNKHRKSSQMTFNSHKTEGGCASADTAALKGQSLSTVLLAHLSHAEGAELYRIFISLQVISQQPHYPELRLD